LFNDRRSATFKFVINIAVINSFITLVHFVLLGSSFLKDIGIAGDVGDFAVPVTITAVVPVILGAYGMYNRRMWGLGLFTLGTGAFLCSSLLVIMMLLKEGTFGAMFYVSAYLALYNIFAYIYSWNYRYNLRDF